MRSLQLDADLVLAVRREVMSDGRAATRAEWLRFAHAIALQQGLRHGVGLHRRADRGVPHRKTTDLSGRRHVALEQRRRQRQHVGDVVEAVARIVGRQQRANVDLEREEIPHGVRVLGAVQPMDDRPSGIRVRRAVRVERRLDPTGDRVIRRPIRPRQPDRRHRAAAQPRGDFFQGARILGDVIEIEGIEREIRGRALLVVAADAVAIERRPTALSEANGPLRTGATDCVA